MSSTPRRRLPYRRGRTPEHWAEGALDLQTRPVMACNLKTLDSESIRSIVTARGRYPICEQPPPI